MRWLILAFLACCFSSCVREPSFRKGELPGGSTSGIFILNEGQWTQNNASLDFYDETGGYKRYEDVFRTANGYGLGDVANRMLLDNDTLFIVVNNSRRIYKVALPSLKVLAKLDLPAGSSPRTMVRISPTKAYVNSLLDGRIYIFDPRTMTLLGQISAENYMEDMQLLGGHVFVSCGSYPGGQNNKLAVVDPINDVVIQYITLPIVNPGPLAVSDNGKLLVGLRGDYLNSGSGVSIFSPNSMTIDTTIRFTGSLYGLTSLPNQRLLVNTDSAYTLLDLNTKQFTYNYISRARLNARSSDLLYSAAYDALKNELYIVNAGFGATNGTCTVLDATSLTVRRTLAFGLFSGQILFYRP